MDPKSGTIYADSDPDPTVCRSGSYVDSKTFKQKVKFLKMIVLRFGDNVNIKYTYCCQSPYHHMDNLSHYSV